MTKELEALETFNYIMARCKDEDSYIIKFPLGIQKGTTFGEDMEKAYKVIKEALQRLEQIDNSNPSEALEIVDKIVNYILLDEEYGFIDDEEKQAIIRDRDTIKQALIKAQEQEKTLENFEYENKMLIKENTRNVKIIEEQEKVLEIIKEKWVNVAVLIHSKTVEEYNNNAHTPYNLTKEEFKLLKRWVENE